MAQRQSLQVFYRIVIQKNFSKLTGKYVRWSLTFKISVIHMSFLEKFSKKGLYRRYYPTKFGEIFRKTFFSDKTSSANIYLLKSNSTSSRKRCGIC